MTARSFALALAAVVTATVAVPANATETDQYSSWGKSIDDSTEILNAYFNRELQGSIDDLSGNAPPPPTCSEVANRFQHRLRFIFIFHPVEVWSSSSPLIDRYPDTRAEEEETRHTGLYSNHGWLDISMWMPLGATIEVAGVRIGTDKLAHFVSVGWQYFDTYQRLVERGMSPRDAELKVIHGGIIGERYLLLGYRTSGTLSISDLEADDRGMRFYRDLCNGPNPVLQSTGGVWRISRPIDIARYVTPEWDESYEPQIFRPRRWQAMLPVLRGYCDWLDSPWLAEQRERYRVRDGLTVNESVLLDLVKEGRLPDPRDYSLEAVCGRPTRSLDAGGNADALPRATPTAGLPSLEKEIAGDKKNERTRPILLYRIGWLQPAGPSGSLAVMATNLGADTDCGSLCQVRGAFAQVDAGPGGGRFSVGYGRILCELRRNRTLVHAYLGYGLKASVMRTWGNPWGAPAGKTYVGGAAELAIARVSLELGAQRAIDGPARDWRVIWGLGFGF